MAHPSPELTKIKLHNSGTDKQHQDTSHGKPSFGTPQEGNPTIFGKGNAKTKGSPLIGR